jgi:hypothetical protein
MDPSSHLAAAEAVPNDTHSAFLDDDRRVFLSGFRAAQGGLLDRSEAPRPSPGSSAAARISMITPSRDTRSRSSA